MFEMIPLQFPSPIMKSASYVPVLALAKSQREGQNINIAFALQELTRRGLELRPGERQIRAEVHFAFDMKALSALALPSYACPFCVKPALS